MIRKALFWLHLSAGLSAGLVILVLAATGFILSFEGGVTAALERPLRRVEAAGRQPLPLAELLRRAGGAQPGAGLSALSLEREPGSALKLQFGREHSLYVDPYSGAPLGPGADGAAAFFHKVEDLHRWFGFSGAGRPRAHAVKNAANLLFFVIILSGLVLWWPRGASKAVLWFRRGVRGKARDFNWHNVLGLWAWLPILAISGTGLVLSYAWATGLLYRAVGEAPPPPRAEAPGPEGAQARGREARPERGEGRERRRPGRDGRGDREARDGGRVTARDWARWAEAAQAQVPEWRRLSLRAPRPGQDSVSIQVETADLPPPRGRGQLVLKAVDASLLRWEPYEGQSRGRKLRLWARWTHTGESLGLAGHLLWGAACLSVLVLVCTGLALSWRRFFGRNGAPD